MKKTLQLLNHILIIRRKHYQALIHKTGAPTIHKSSGRRPVRHNHYPMDRRIFRRYLMV